MSRFYLVQLLQAEPNTGCFNESITNRTQTSRKQSNGSSSRQNPQIKTFKTKHNEEWQKYTKLYFKNYTSVKQVNEGECNEKKEKKKKIYKYYGSMEQKKSYHATTTKFEISWNFQITGYAKEHLAQLIKRDNKNRTIDTILIFFWRKQQKIIMSISKLDNTTIEIIIEY